MVRRGVIDAGGGESGVGVVVPTILRRTGGLMVVHDEIPHVCLEHLLHHLVPGVVVQLSVLRVHLGLELAQPGVPRRGLVATSRGLPSNSFACLRRR